MLYTALYHASLWMLVADSLVVLGVSQSTAMIYVASLSAKEFPIYLFGYSSQPSRKRTMTILWFCQLI